MADLEGCPVLAEQLLHEAVAPRSSSKKALPLLLVSLFVGAAVLGSGWRPSGPSPSAVAQELPALPAAAVRPITSQKAWAPAQARAPMQAVRMQPVPAFKPMFQEMETGEPATAAITRSPVNRRDLIGALLVGGSAAVWGGPAKALIPDDDDQDLLKAAKAKRKAKIQEEKKVERSFQENTGQGLDELKRELKPVQLAIGQMAKAGTNLANDDAKAAATELNGPWVNDFKTAALKVSATEDAKDLVKPLVEGVKKIKESSERNKLPEAKTAFKAFVSDFKSWEAAAQVESLLQGV
jgi:hypothetical protein